MHNAELWVDSTLLHSEDISTGRRITNQPINQPSNQATKQPIIQPINQPTKQTTNQLNRKHNLQPISKHAN